MKNFDLQRMLTESTSAQLKLRQVEHEQSRVLSKIQKQYDDKKAECESLEYQIAHQMPMKGIPTRLFDDEKAIETLHDEFK